MLLLSYLPWKTFSVALIFLASISACSSFSLLSPPTPFPYTSSTHTIKPTILKTSTSTPLKIPTATTTIISETVFLPTETPTITETIFSWKVITPTPDIPRVLPTLRSESVEYVVKSGDTLNQIARGYTTSVQAIAEANQLEDINILQVGKLLVIPPPDPQANAPGVKIIPDSELVFGPASVDFDIKAFIQDQGGYLAGYREEIEDVELTGAEILERISRLYSVNPRLLLALLEYQSGWVTQPDPEPGTLNYPLHNMSTRITGLNQQLAWAANELNRGYYLWRINALAAVSLADGTVVNMDATINSGTAGVQLYFAQIYDLFTWEQAISPDGLLTVYTSLFGSPFAVAVEPLIPPDLVQPPLELPFEPDKVWRYTGGPHGGWANGSAWAALDF
ncbi:MAG: LysM peptidoglycan-binding domain-containing protein, partial [Anaerolineales bacterium]|nr:LysM peptidoglycan-binding domain-containing protein [Anaerolineales bacterium]